MRISDWSSDVCSSDLVPRAACGPEAERRGGPGTTWYCAPGDERSRGRRRGPGAGNRAGAGSTHRLYPALHRADETEAARPGSRDRGAHEDAVYRPTIRRQAALPRLTENTRHRTGPTTLFA